MHLVIFHLSIHFFGGKLPGCICILLYGDRFGPQKNNVDQAMELLEGRVDDMSFSPVSKRK